MASLFCANMALRRLEIHMFTGATKSCHRTHLGQNIWKCVRHSNSQPCSRMIHREQNEAVKSILNFPFLLRKIPHLGKSGRLPFNQQNRYMNTGKAPLKNGLKKTSAPVPKSSDAWRLLSLAKPERFRLIAAIGLLLISSGVTMAVPFGIGRVIDIIYAKSTDGKMIERLKRFCKILLGVFLVGAVANFGRVYLMTTSGNRIVKRLRERIYNSIICQEVSFFDKTKTGELINRLSADTSLVGQSVTMNISDGLRSVAQASAGLSMMVYMSPKLAMVAMAIVPPIAIVSRYYGRYLQKITKNVQDALADSTQIAEERIGNIRTVRAFAQEAKEKEAYDKKITEVLDLTYKEALARGVFWASTGLSGNFVIISVFYYGGLMMNDSMITVGELSSFLLYAAFVGISIGGMTSFYSELMRGIGASHRLWQLIDKTPAIPVSGGLIPTNPMAGHVQFRSVHFAYPTRINITIFSDLNLEVERGSVLAVVGASGSGKSTLASLLMRYYDPSQGSVLVDGVDVTQLDPHWLRSNIGVVSQEPTLFSSSIHDNIAYGTPETVSPEQIIEAAKLANAYDFIQRFPNGFDTLVGERGIMLSGGQKQRIAIARAIIKDPKILLLDEATSALDSESEYLVQEAIERAMVGRTVITIAHRLSTIQNADQISVLDEGKVVEKGNYTELMSIDKGLFKKLVERQTISSK